jgi:hypothetical protein
MNPLRASLVLALGLSPAAFAQSGGPYNLTWNTFDGGGGTSSGGVYSISGTAGQPDAGAHAGGAYDHAGGFWAAFTGGPCYANCDNSTQPPILNVLDFQCFLNRFAANDPYANCDNSTVAPTLNVLDFGCFLNRFAAGCP